MVLCLRDSYLEYRLWLSASLSAVKKKIARGLPSSFTRRIKKMESTKGQIRCVYKDFLSVCHEHNPLCPYRKCFAPIRYAHLHLTAAHPPVYPSSTILLPRPSMAQALWMARSGWLKRTSKTKILSLSRLRSSIGGNFQEGSHSSTSRHEKSSKVRKQIRSKRKTQEE